MTQYSDNYEGIVWKAREGRIRNVKQEKKPHLVIVKDIEPFESPIDKSIISSRSGLREHERKHNVRQIGNDWAGSERPSNWENLTNGGN
jgi:hypothetical protein|tara:strand:+ start:137 stop:403 length:267 start_codon:yes stop_codon:yes gene_type:complete